ncbi:MAG: WbqC family protein [candidate division SR1 bacterium]|nr:WbqC family protein [candidate division SR1 bacterium]
MRCSIHQPNYIPYLGLFNKIYLSDIFVFYDNAQFTKGDYHNRNKVKGANGEVLLSLPVKVSLGQKINEVSFDNKILRKHWTTIEQSYKKAPYFNTYGEEIRRKIYETEETNIAKFNIETIIFLSRLIGIERTSFITLSEILPDLEHSSTKALVDICKEIGSDFYISGAGGRGYVEADLFSDAKIELVFQEYKHPVYSQLWGDFLPYMSILDLIFNEGPNSLSFISQNSIGKI